jgi:hypothetical protein
MAMTPTQLQDAVIEGAQRYGNGKFENLTQSFGAFKAVEASTPESLPISEILAAKRASAHVVKLPQMNKQNYTVNSVRSCTPSGTDATSAFQSLSFATIATQIVMYPAEARFNYIGYEAQFAQKIFQALKNLFNDLETKTLTFLEANKSAINNTSFTSDGWSVASGVVSASKATWKTSDMSEYYAALPVIMAENYQRDGGYQIITNRKPLAYSTFYQNQGTANAKNTSYQFNGLTFHASDSLTPTAGSDGTQYVFQMGDVAVGNWNPYEFEENYVATQAEWYSTIDSSSFGFPRLNFGVFYRDTCADRSGVQAGTENSRKHVWEISTDIFFLSAYSSDTSKPIKKFELLNT